MGQTDTAFSKTRIRLVGDADDQRVGVTISGTEYCLPPNQAHALALDILRVVDAARAGEPGGGAHPCFTVPPSGPLTMIAGMPGHSTSDTPQSAPSWSGGARIPESESRHAWTIFALNTHRDADGDWHTEETFIGSTNDRAVADAYRSAEYKVVETTLLPMPAEPLPRGTTRSF